MASNLLDYAQRLLTVSHDALTNPVERKIVCPGAEIPWDEGSQLSVVVQSVSPNYSSQGFCQKVLDYSVTYLITLHRCVASLTDGGYAPNPWEIEQDSTILFQDMTDIGQALTCQLADEGVTVLTGSPLGPSGGYAAVTWTVNKRLRAL